MLYSEASWTGPDVWGVCNPRPFYFQHIADYQERKIREEKNARAREGIDRRRGRR